MRLVNTRQDEHIGWLTKEYLQLAEEHAKVKTEKKIKTIIMFSFEPTYFGILEFGQVFDVNVTWAC